MARIEPFRALRYDSGRLPDLAAVVTPPYDVIPPEAQLRYRQRHPYNFVRLILAREDPPDETGRDRYDRAGRAYRDWQRSGVLRRDPAPALYLYEQSFAIAGRRLRRRGFLAALRLEAYEAGVVFPHERTFSRHKDDRLRLMRTCPANLEAILGFYAGPAAPVTELLERGMTPPPSVALTDEEGESHRLWPLTDPDEIRLLQAALADRPVFIADGHHRYETALQFRDERRRQTGAAGESDFVLTNLIHAEDPGLLILPTHRILRQPPGVSGPALRAGLERRFQVTEVPIDPVRPAAALQAVLADLSAAGQERPVFALYAGGSSILRLALQDEGAIHALAAEGQPECAWRLPVAVLHRLVIEELFGIAGAGAGDESLGYTRDALEAFRAVADGGAHAALFLNPPRVEDVRAIASEGGRMPHKSTYFYPKVLSGLVVRPLE
jgi:uncharacterized protein (DUF1015 family)